MTDMKEYQKGNGKSLVSDILSEEKQQKENTYYIAAILFGAMIVIILNIITVYRFIDYIKDENWEMNSESADAVTNEITGYIDTLMSTGQYEAAIQTVLDTDLDETAGADYLQKAIDELYLQCISESSALAANNDYDAAIAMIDGRLQYLADIAVQTGYVRDKHEYDLGEQRNQLAQTYTEYLYQTARDCSNNGDENGMLEAFDRLSAFASLEEVEKKKVELYTNLVLVNMTNMSASGESAENIAGYINSKLGDTGNNCRLVEFWEYYDDVYHKQIGKNRMTETKVHVSDAGYILPDSNLRVLSYSDINGLSEYELYFALFEIYARHNRIFSDSVVTSHFQQNSWYSGTVRPEDFDETILSDIEKQNINTIISYQRDMGYR